MGSVKLLDCTLRDGGYVNDWKFGHDNLVSIFERVVSAGTDIIEIGFLDERRPFDIDRSIMPNTDCVGKIYGGLDRRNTTVLGMIDYGTCGLENIKPCDECFLDGIRVIFKKHLRVEALDFCAELRKLGYIVFAQLVSVTSYSDKEMMDLIRLANIAKPSAVSIVDTYGLMHQNNLRHYFKLLNDGLEKTIAIGYHGHNNFQMGYANSIAMLENKVDRDLVVDGSLYGMGKSAGNAPIELIAMQMNRTKGNQYVIEQYLEAIEANVYDFYEPATWGYNLFFYLAASNDCHPNYVKFLMEKRTLSIKSIIEILNLLQGEKKLLYNKELIEQLYADYQDREINDDSDFAALKEQLKGKTILLMGPGKSINESKDIITDVISKDIDTAISINYNPDFIDVDYIFVSNSKRYSQLCAELSRKHKTVIATSNVTSMGYSFDYILNVSKLLDFETEIIDNSLIMILQVLSLIGVKSVLLFGFDGYSGTEQNYFDDSKEYIFAKEKADYLNEYVNKKIREMNNSVEIKTVTDTVYEIKKVEQ